MFLAAILFAALPSAAFAVEEPSTGEPNVELMEIVPGEIAVVEEVVIAEQDEAGQEAPQIEDQEDGALLLNVNGDLQAKTESALRGAPYNQTAGKYDYTVIKSITVTGTPTAGDIAFIEKSLAPGLFVLDMSGITNSITFPHMQQNESKLKTVSLPRVGYRLPYMCFYGCANLEAVDNLDKITEIPQSAFENCKKLTSIALNPVGCTVGQNAFRYCSGLTAVNNLDKVTSIGARGFSGCTGLKSITINPACVLGNAAFSNCTSLATIANLDRINVFNGGSEFAGCTSLKSVTLSPDIVYIANGTFAGCSSLKEVKNMDKLQAVPANAFERCVSLSSISLANCKELGFSAFAGCGRLEEAVWPKAAPNYGGSVFSRCAFDFTSGYPENSGITAANVVSVAPNQTPVFYFSLTTPSQTIKSGEALKPNPPYTFKTKYGYDYKKLISESPLWLNKDTGFGLPKVTVKPTLDTKTPGTRNYTYSIPSSVYANMYSLTFKLTVLGNIKVKSIQPNIAAATLNKSRTVTLTVKVLPSDAGNKAVSWKSSDTAVATVDSNGVVKGIKAGSSSIIATAKDGSGIKGVCKITVK